MEESDKKSNKFSKIYTTVLLKTLAVNLKFCGQYAPDILPEYIDGKIARTLLTIIKDYINKYERELNLTRLIEEIDALADRRGLDSTTVDLLTDEAKLIFETEEGPEQYVIDNLMDFCRRQAMKSALRQAVELLKDNSSDYGQIGKLVDSALTVGAGTDIGYFFEDLYEIQDLYRDKYRPEDLIKTGFPTLDQSLKGGMAPGEVHVCIGSPKIGKSSMLSSVSAYNVIAKKVVFHISLEISAVEVLAKIAARITGMTLDDIFDKESPEYSKKMERYKKRSPNLYVNHWTESTVDCLTIRSWISRIRASKGVKPDLIVLDYDDCGVGETLISMLDGTERRIDSLLDEKEFWVYSCKEDGTVVPGKGHSARKVRDVTELYEVELDNGKIERFTNNHRWMMRDGFYKRTEQLQPNDSLMPLYRKVDSNGYEYHKDNYFKRYKATHRKFAEILYPKEKLDCLARTTSAISDVPVVHHQNENKRDNKPSNLQWLTNSEHVKHHSQFLGENSVWKDPEWVAKKSKLTSDQWTPEFYEKRSNETSKQWEETNIGELVSTAFTKAWIDPNSKFNADKVETCPHCNTLLELPFNKWRSHLQHCNQNPDKIAQTLERNTVKNRNCRKCNNLINTSWYGLNGHTRFCSGTHNNHKVVSVKRIVLDTPVPVYDITVDDYHNFALSSGVFVHNCLLPIKKSSKASGDMYGDGGEVYNDMKALANYFSCPILCAAQPHRAAWQKYEKEGNMVDSGDLAHSAKKAMKATSMFSLNFKKDDDYGWLYLDIVRRGTGNRKIPIVRKLDRATFIEGHDSKASEDEG